MKASFIIVLQRHRSKKGLLIINVHLDMKDLGIYQSNYVWELIKKGKK